MQSQFGAAKNPPWARQEFISAGAQNTMTPTTISQGNNVLQPTIFSLNQQQQQLQQTQFNAQQMQQQNLAGAGLPQPGIAIPTTLATSQVATISYPAPRAAPSQNLKQRVFTGTVTKLHDNFGFVDEDVFFQLSSVKGNMPKVGDRVLVEASYNANMPFKWNATRIQLLPNQMGPTPMNAGNLMGNAGNMNNPGPMGPNMMGNPNPNLSMGNAGVIGNLGNLASMAGGMGAQLKMPGQGLMQTPAQQNMASVAQAMAQAVSGMAQAAMAPVVTPMVTPSSMGLGGQQPALLGQAPGILQRPGMMGPGRFGGMKTDRDRDRDRERDMRDRSHRQEDRGVKRPRSPRKMRSHSPTGRRSRSPPRRRTPRIIPKYVVQFPRVSLDVKEANVIVLKSKYTNMYIPSDFFHTTLSWTEAFPLDRPFQLGNTCAFHIMGKDTDPVTPNATVFDPPDADHLFSAKVMLLASHSMDELLHKCAGLAEDLETKESFQHPTRLLNFLVGVRGKNEPMAIGGPWSPSQDGQDPISNPQVLIKTAIRTTKALTGIDLSCCTQWYRFAEIRYLRPEGTHKGRQLPTRVETVVLFLPDIWTCCPTRLEWGTLKAAYAKQLQRKIAAVENKDEPSQEEEEMETEEGAPRKGPTHYSELDPKSMKIVDLRQELESRSLSAKGLKSQLIARLTKTLRTEQEKEEEEAEKQPVEENPPPQDEEENADSESPEEIKKREEEEERKKKEKRQLEKKYALPENPAILVHPSATAKSGKFDCTMMSLSVLLDYRPEDNKEHSFEVSLFAEMFNEMLIRDFGFKIYDALMRAPPKKEEKKSDKKEKDKDKKKTDDKDKEKDKDNHSKKDKEKSEEENEKSASEEKDEPMDDDEGDGEDEDDEEESRENGQGKKSNDSKDKDKEKKREKKKLETKLPHLLLAFTYFDQNHTSYVLDKDLEDMFLTLGLHLSRAQIKKLMQKVTSRDTLHYRKLTDFPPDADPAKEEKPMPDTAVLNFALGNLEYLKGVRPGVTDPAEKTVSKSEDSNFITFRGATVDVGSLIERLDRSENSRTAVEAKLTTLMNEIVSLKSSLTDSDGKCQKLSGNLKTAQEQLDREKKRHTDADSKSRHLEDVLSETRDTLSEALTSVSRALSMSVNAKEEEEEEEAKVEVKEEPMLPQEEEEDQ